MTRWLRILIICVSLPAFLLRNASALGECHHDHDDDAVMLASSSAQDFTPTDDPDSAPSHPPCQMPGGCVHCTIAQMPCAAEDVSVTLITVCLGDVLPEASLDYTPPSAGQLIRPPR